MKVLEALAPFATTITVAIIAVTLIFFRADVRKLIEWVSKFSRLAKNRDGYEAAQTPPPQPSVPEEQKEVKKLDAPTEVLAQKAEAKGNDEGDAHTWVKAWIDNDYQKAYELLDKYIKKKPPAPEQEVHMKSLLGHMLFALDAKKGELFFRDLTANHSTEADPFQWWAISLRNLRQFNEAVEVLDTGLATVHDKASLLSDKVTTLQAAGKLDDATRTAHAAIKEWPEEMSLYLKLAEIYLSKDDKPNAVAVLTEAIRVKPQHEASRAKLAEIFYDNDAYAHAASHYAYLANQHPKNSRYPTLLANAYVALKFYDRAMTKYRLAEKLAEGKEGWILGNIGNILHARGFHEEAIQHLKKGLEIEPTSTYMHRRLAEAMEENEAETKKVSEALDAVTQGNAMLPEALRLPGTKAG